MGGRCGNFGGKFSNFGDFWGIWIWGKFVDSWATKNHLKKPKNPPKSNKKSVELSHPIFSIKIVLVATESFLINFKVNRWICSPSKIALNFLQFLTNWNQLGNEKKKIRKFS
jgi:hypothetical protein